MSDRPVYTVRRLLTLSNPLAESFLLNFVALSTMAWKPCRFYPVDREDCAFATPRAYRLP